MSFQGCAEQQTSLDFHFLLRLVAKVQECDTESSILRKLYVGRIIFTHWNFRENNWPRLLVYRNYVECISVRWIRPRKRNEICTTPYVLPIIISLYCENSKKITCGIVTQNKNKLMRDHEINRPYCTNLIENFTWVRKLLKANTILTNSRAVKTMMKFMVGLIRVSILTTSHRKCTEPSILYSV